MSKQITKGEKDKSTGQIRDDFGKSTHNKSEQLRGKFQKTKGRAEIGIGKARRKF
jgi:uncharacterized protein YjbJ (UPF0337 family)